MTKTDYIEFHNKFCEDMVRITQAKNSDYTGGSDDPFANFLGISHLVDAPNVVEIGFLTRMSDKMARIGSYISKGTLEVKDESVMDTLKDLANYSALFAGYLESKKSVEQPQLPGFVDISNEPGYMSKLAFQNVSKVINEIEAKKSNS